MLKEWKNWLCTRTGLVGVMVEWHRPPCEFLWHISSPKRLKGYSGRREFMVAVRCIVGCRMEKPGMCYMQVKRSLIFLPRFYAERERWTVEHKGVSTRKKRVLLLLGYKHRNLCMWERDRQTDRRIEIETGRQTTQTRQTGKVQTGTYIIRSS